MRSIVLSFPEGTRVVGRVVTDNLFALEVDEDALAGLAPGRQKCNAALSVMVLPGRILGQSDSRILIEHEGAAPRVVSSPGQVRLVWVPEARGDGEVESQPRTAAAAPRSADRAASGQETQPADTVEAPRRRTERAPSKSRDLDEAGRSAAASAASDTLLAPAARPAPPPPARAPAAALPPAPGQRTAPAAPTGPRGLPPDFRPLDPPRSLVATLAADTRTGPGRRFAAGRRLVEGESVRSDGRTPDWYRLDDGSWVFAADVRSEGEGLAAGASSARVATTVAPVHSGPGRHFEIIAELRAGESVVLDDRREEWVHVRNGGWILLAQLEQNR